MIDRFPSDPLIKQALIVVRAVTTFAACMSLGKKVANVGLELPKR